MVETPFVKGMGNEEFFLNELLSILNPGDVAYDIGASIGIHAVFMSKKVGSTGQIIAFEPEDQSYQSLQTNIELNDLSNVVPIQSALGHMKAEGTLHSRGSTADFSLTDKLEGKKYHTTRIVTGDSLVKEMNLPSPKVVKIDVEGYEYYVLQGLKNTLTHGMCQMVCCEIHPTMLPHGTTPEKVIELLKSCGFDRIKNHPRGETLHTFCYKG
jgi:FkbM family methyltransferase